jgi:hypothetical protein
MLLTSPKAGISSKFKARLPFLVLFIVVGIVVSRSWSYMGARMDPGCSTLPKDDQIAYAESIERQDETHTQKRTANVSLPLIWLMSFPASTKFYYVCDVMRRKPKTSTQHSSPFVISRIREHPTRAISSGPSRGKTLPRTTVGNTLIGMERANPYSKTNPEARSGLPP